MTEIFKNKEIRQKGFEIMKNFVKKIREYTTYSKLINFININETPAIVYDLDILNSIISEFRKNINCKEYIKLYFAVKSNNNRDLIGYMSKLVDGFDVASIYEFNIVKDMGLPISYTSPSISTENFKYLFNNTNVNINLDSLEQVDNYLYISNTENIGLRLNISCIPEKSSRFGILLDNNSINYLKNNNIKINSLHFHAEARNEFYFKKVIFFIENLIKNKLLDTEEIESLNLGGGFLDNFVNNKFEELFNFIDFLKETYFSKNTKIKFIFEPGAAISIFLGFLITEVSSVKNVNNKNFVTLNSSAYNLNKWYKSIPIYTSSNNDIKIDYTLCGNTCYEDDIFVNCVNLNKLSKGDKIIFFPFGAYTRSNSSNLHGLNIPKEYYYKSGELINEW